MAIPWFLMARIRMFMRSGLDRFSDWFEMQMGNWVRPTSWLSRKRVTTTSLPGFAVPAQPPNESDAAFAGADDTLDEMLRRIERNGW
jgi:hypothetical protein